MAPKEAKCTDENELSLKGIILGFRAWIKYICSKWHIILVAGILGAAIGLGYALLQKPSYIATTTFVLEGGDGRGGLNRYSGVAMLAGIDISGGGGLFQGENILELYRSRKMLSQTLFSKTCPDSNELLIERYIAINNLRNEWKDKPKLLELDFRLDINKVDSQTSRIREGLVTSIANSINTKNLTVEFTEKGSSIIKVEVVSSDEVFSKAFNENLVRKVNEFYIQTKTKKSTANIGILQQKVDSVRAVMSGAIYSAAKVSDATPNLNPTRQVNRVAPAQEAQFSAETNKALLAELLQNLELTKMNLLQEQPLIQLIDQPIYPLPLNNLSVSKGLIAGACLLVFFILMILVIRRIYDNIMDKG